MQGLLSCGQFEMRQTTSIAATISTYLPGAEIPSANVSPPSGDTGTFMKKLMLHAMSRFVSSTFHSCAPRMKESRQACMHSLSWA